MHNLLKLLYFSLLKDRRISSSSENKAICTKAVYKKYTKFGRDTDKDTLIFESAYNRFISKAVKSSFKKEEVQSPVVSM